MSDVISSQACNSNGDIGMVPENYIERYEDVASLNENNNQSIEEAVPPPPLPVDYSPNAPLPPSVPPPPIDTPVLPPVGTFLFIIQTPKVYLCTI